MSRNTAGEKYLFPKEMENLLPKAKTLEVKINKLDFIQIKMSDKRRASPIKSIFSMFLRALGIHWQGNGQVKCIDFMW